RSILEVRPQGQRPGVGGESRRVLAVESPRGSRCGSAGEPELEVTGAEAGPQLQAPLERRRLPVLPELRGRGPEPKPVSRIRPGARAGLGAGLWRAVRILAEANHPAQGGARVSVRPAAGERGRAPAELTATGVRKTQRRSA